jgi:hypothetical protein
MPTGASHTDRSPVGVICMPSPPGREKVIQPGGRLLWNNMPGLAGTSSITAL